PAGPRLTSCGGAAECLPGRRVGHGGVQRRLRHADSGGSDTRAEEVERPHREAESTVDLAHDSILGNKDTIQLQSTDRMRREEVLRGSTEPFRIAVDD